MNKTKTRINPYLIVLLKNMLSFEFVGMEKDLNNLEIAAFVYERSKSDDHKQTSYSDKKEIRDSVAYSRAERIRKYLLSPEDFEFSINQLNIFIEEVSVFGNFRSWEEFSNRFSNNANAIYANRSYMDVPYSQLDNFAKTEIAVGARTDLYNLYYFKKKNEGFIPQNIIKNENDFVIRPANSREIKDIERIAQIVYPCPINKADVKRIWHEKNPLIYFVYRDHCGVWANLNLLPIDQYLFKDLKEGKRYEDNITKSDLYTPEERSLVNHIYVEGLACTMDKKILLLFLEGLEAMINKLANSNNKNLIICAIGGSKQGDRLMKKFGFEASGKSFDKRSNEEYPFFEIKWSDLKENINNNDFLSTYFNGGKRLTPIN